MRKLGTRYSPQAHCVHRGPTSSGAPCSRWFTLPSSERCSVVAPLARAAIRRLRRSVLPIATERIELAGDEGDLVGVEDLPWVVTQIQRLTPEPALRLGHGGHRNGRSAPCSGKKKAAAVAAAAGSGEWTGSQRANRRRKIAAASTAIPAIPYVDGSGTPAGMAPSVVRRRS